MKINCEKVKVEFKPPQRSDFYRKSWYIVDIKIIFKNVNNWLLTIDELNFEQLELINNILIDKNQALLNKNIQDKEIQKIINFKIYTCPDVIPESNFDFIKKFYYHARELDKLYEN